MKAPLHTSKTKKILVTGGAGFIGSAFVRQAVAAGHKIIVVDKLTYAGDLMRLRTVRKAIRFYKADIAHPTRLKNIVTLEKPTIIAHFAAETHVDRSILDTKPFIATNVEGTQNLIRIALDHGIKRFVHISTDEVYGEITKGQFNEHSPLNPGNPYSATKAAADLLVKAAIRTYKLPALIIRPSNNYGPWQYPEKLIPVIILKALKNQKIPVYGEGMNVREWLYVEDCAAAVHTILDNGKLGEVYNISSYMERRNIDTVKTLLEILGKPTSLIKFVQDRPGHDFRYSLNCAKLRKLGWRPQVTFEKGAALTVAWNQENRRWLESKLESLQAYWKKVYKKK